MINLIHDHPYLCAGAAFWLALVIFGWLFMAGAAIASGRD
jgi:hypothetical protein